MSLLRPDVIKQHKPVKSSFSFMLVISIFNVSITSLSNHFDIFDTDESVGLCTCGFDIDLAAII